MLLYAANKQNKKADIVDLKNQLIMLNDRFVPLYSGNNVRARFLCCLRLARVQKGVPQKTLG